MLCHVPTGRTLQADVETALVEASTLLKEMKATPDEVLRGINVTMHSAMSDIVKTLETRLRLCVLLYTSDDVLKAIGQESKDFLEQYMLPSTDSMEYVIKRALAQVDSDTFLNSLAELRLPCALATLTQMGRHREEMQNHTSMEDHLGLGVVPVCAGSVPNSTLLEHSPHASECARRTAASHIHRSSMCAPTGF